MEWREAAAGQPILRHIGSDNATHYVRRFLTALLDIPLGMELRYRRTLKLTLAPNIFDFDITSFDNMYKRV